MSGPKHRSPKLLRRQVKMEPLETFVALQSSSMTDDVVMLLNAFKTRELFEIWLYGRPWPKVIHMSKQVTVKAFLKEKYILEGYFPTGIPAIPCYFLIVAAESQLALESSGENY